MQADLIQTLRDFDIQPSAQRVAVAEYVLKTSEHPSADVVFQKVIERFPLLSRATVYNTLNLFVEKGLLRQLVISEGKVVFDPMVEPHHHFVDEETGLIHDIPWSALRVARIDTLTEFDVREYQVVLRGKKKQPSRSS